jgi:hypothetical protein
LLDVAESIKRVSVKNVLKISWSCE